MQRDADQDDDAMSRTVDDATTDDVNMETASSPTPGKRDGGDAVGNPHVKKRQRTSHATLENDAPPPPPPAARDKSNFLSTDTQKAKVKKRGFSIAHEFEREINVAQPPTSLQQSQSPDRRSVSPVPPPLAHRGGNDVDFFPPAPSLFSSPKPPTPETGAARKPKRSTATATHRRDTISPGRAVPMPQSELPGDNSSSRRDTLSPDGFRRIESLVEDEESSQERAGHKELEEEEKTEEGKDSSHRHDDSPTHAATPHPIETRRLPTSPKSSNNDNDDDVVAHSSPPHATTVASVRGAAAAAEKNDMAARRSTLDPSELAGMFGSSDLATSHDMAASGRRDTLDPLEALAVLEGMSTLEGGEHEGQQHKKKKLAQELALDSHATIGPTNQHGTSNKDNASRRDTLNPSDLMQLDSDDDDDHLTPLKSCLSARKAQPPPSSSPTPTKSVVFGSPRGAEFRRNDPPTSMTPMCVLQTREMFPLDKIDSDDDDDVTSENTSILDEADHFLDKEEENHSLSFPFGSIRSPTRKRNQAAPNNVVGVSPLDNIADARR
ncbi:hypothetical protein DYB28_005419 [Aphanomyces astaci]|uniref:Uncharacterized protein n=1 Tax=Aphanomyces astaci TaxID=112090 RepID=A0A9X8E470_APHAT|nr:hypothetical protein DYB28_005419 [Aphanomyces astaci]